MTVQARETDPADPMAKPDPGTAGIPFRFQAGGFLLVLSGPSGAGKGTLVERLVKARPECVFAISSTTRPRRSTESDGVQYEFVTRDEFEHRRRAGYFLESAEVHGHCYGTPARFVDDGIASGRIVVLDVDVQGGASVRRVRPDAVSIFIYPPSIDALRRRLLKRATDAAEVVERRLKDAPGELAEYRHYDYLVMNDDLEQAVARLVGIVDAERARVRRLRPLAEDGPNP
ncbi:MAG TPA: guanylate kinase [Candidatus Sulfotelmatobacter sp.]|nr:guanylate kinase [Candidatus Sulfotelmatobacter sp.]